MPIVDIEDVIASVELQIIDELKAENERLLAFVRDVASMPCQSYPGYLNAICGTCLPCRARAALPTTGDA